MKALKPGDKVLVEFTVIAIDGSTPRAPYVLENKCTHFYCSEGLIVGGNKTEAELLDEIEFVE